MPAVGAKFPGRHAAHALLYSFALVPARQIVHDVAPFSVAT